MFIRLSKKWYALTTEKKSGSSLITLVLNSLAKTHCYLLPDFKVEHGIVVNFDEVVSVDDTPIAERLMQIKKGVSV